MNFIGAFILFVTANEKKGYEMFKTIMFNDTEGVINIGPMFVEGLPLVLKLNDQFRVLFESKFPKLKEHFDDICFMEALWV
jgi:hypothetical protein